MTKPRKRRKRIGLDDGRDSTPRGDLNSGDGAGPSSGLGPGLGRRLGAGGSGDGDDNNITIADLAAVADLAANASPSPLVKARPAKAPRREMAAVNRGDALAHMSVDSIIATINRNLASKSQAKEEAVEPKPERVRKKPGPKPGSKNRKRLAAEAAAAAAAGEAGTSPGARATSPRRRRWHRSPRDVLSRANVRSRRATRARARSHARQRRRRGFAGMGSRGSPTLVRL